MKIKRNFFRPLPKATLSPTDLHSNQLSIGYLHRIDPYRPLPGTTMFSIFPRTGLVAFASAALILGCNGQGELDPPDPTDAGPTDTAEDISEDTGEGTDDAIDDADASADDVSEDTADTDEPVEPEVAFASPADGATVDNPVIFEIEATGVDEVEIFADETYSLGQAFDPDEDPTLRYRFAGTGFERPLHVEGRVDGEKVDRDDLSLTVNPDSCEDQFFLTRFDQENDAPSGEIDMFAIREDSLAAVKSEIESLQSCGADLTLGAMMSLLNYEALFRAGAFNTRCNENSYHNTESDCDEVAEALYSYQFGIGGIHTSNFHPCKGGSWTQGMRQRFHEVADEIGYDTDDDIVTDALANRFWEVCPDEEPRALDYYILGAHEHFDIPRNDAGNHLEAVGDYPLMDPAISVPLTFHILQVQCDDITGDRDAIEQWGGGDPAYGTQDRQDQILARYENFAAANCD